MFLNYRRGFQHAREKLPFALAQASKVMRNEISPRRGLQRLREFTIMELELFFDPDKPDCPWYDEVSGEGISLITEEMEAQGVTEPLHVTVKEAVDKGLILTEWQGYFMGLSKRFLEALGIPPEKQRYRAHLPDERAHYSAQTFDHEVDIENFGWTEISGCAYRTDFDLKSHMDASGLDMTVLRQDGSRVVPHVVEPSYGLERLFLATISNSYERKNKRNILHLPRNLAPYQVSVFPLVSKDGLPEKALEIHRMVLDAGLWAFYDERGSIGRRYARSDEIGTPLAVAIDYDTLEDGSLTIRDRDSWTQVRVDSSVLVEKLVGYFKDIYRFEDLGELIERD
jgi:glycyl-tRNA synthetase